MPTLGLDDIRWLCHYARKYVAYVLRKIIKKKRSTTGAGANEKLVGVRRGVSWHRWMADSRGVSKVRMGYILPGCQYKVKVPAWEYSQPEVFTLQKLNMAKWMFSFLIGNTTSFMVDLPASHLSFRSMDSGKRSFVGGKVVESKVGFLMCRYFLTPIY